MYPETILPIVAHIPHAGTDIPTAVRDQFLIDQTELWQEVTALTDWYTDELFTLPGIAVSQTPISRIVVDLERYTDDSLEEKAAFGQGVIYSHSTEDKPIRRELSEKERRQLLDNFYRPWHLQLELNIEQQIARWGHCLLLDCHSFPSEPFANEDDRGRPRPDICLGTGNNTPQWLVDHAVDLFRNQGYSVEVDFPYPGCLVPDRFQGDPRVPAIMIEINRHLYLEPLLPGAHQHGSAPATLPRFDALKNGIWSVMLSLSQVATCRVG
jgi:N-formylglutamate amidohydrolase